MSTQKLLEKIYERMGTKDTAELIAIWKENDHGLWSDSAFEVIQNLLLERGVPLPSQGEMKVTIPPTPHFEIPWDIPYFSWLRFCLPWILFGLFLVWIFLIHPFYFFTRFDGPLWPDLYLRLAGWYGVLQNIEIYGKLYLGLRYIEFGIMSYGILVGYFVLRKSQKAVAMVKVYLIQFLLFSIYLLLFFNVVPLAILYWEVSNSIFDLAPNWEMWIDTMGLYSMRTSRWGFFVETVKVYSIPLFSTLIWYIFLIRSKWIAKTFPPTSSPSS